MCLGYHAESRSVNVVCMIVGSLMMLSEFCYFALEKIQFANAAAKEKTLLRSGRSRAALSQH